MKVLGAFILAAGLLATADAFDLVRVPSVLVRWSRHSDSLTAWTYRTAAIALGAALLFLTPRGDDRA